LAFIPEPLRRQNETIRALQRELDNQKWVFEQFLRSPSWRVTAPLRWLAGWLRALTGRRVNSSTIAAASAQAGSEDLSDLRSLADSRLVMTSLYATTLHSFLTSEGTLQLPASERPEVSIILVLHNRVELTLACLRSVAENHNLPLEVIIVDNASTDETSILLDRLRGARVIRNTENRHFLLAVNQAAELARGETLVLLNNDAQLMPGALRAALDTLYGAPDVGAVGGKLILYDGVLQEAGSMVFRDGSCHGYGRGDIPFAPQYMFRRDVDYCSGAFLATRRSCWRELGGFDERFKPAYYEETDYCMRLWRRGYRVVYEPQAVALHYEFASSASAAGAIKMQAERQQVFVERHRSELKDHEAPDLSRAVWARSRNTTSRILMLDDRIPHSWLGAGFPRARRLLDALVQAGHFVTFYPLTQTNEDWADIYADTPREVEVMNDAGPATLEVFLKSRLGYYDVIVVSRPHNMEFLQPILKNHPDWFEKIRVIYDAEALFAFREAGLRALQGSPMPQSEFEEILKREIARASGADVIVAVSEGDHRAMLEHGAKDVVLLGHALEPRLTDQPFDTRTGILFAGAVHEEESPNGDSLIWFLSEVFPRILRELGPDTPFTIAGVNKSERIRRLATPPVRLVGSVPDLAALYGASRVFVAPTRYAAGIPHKIHEAAMSGLPVVGTPLLASQLSWSNEEMAIAGSAEDFARRVVELYCDAGRWAALRHAAFERASRECSIDRFNEKARALAGVGHVAPKVGMSVG
jgi:GT2 family glycosyltransferase